LQACAIIWDYDGTLVDSRHRHLGVNRRILERLSGRTWTEFPALASIEAYDAAVARCTNWRDFYEHEFGLREGDLAAAGRLWTEGQRTDPTPVLPFEGVPEAVEALGHLPQGIVSQNAREIIGSTLGRLGLAHRFHPVVGYAEVPLGRQKPAPDGLLQCLEEIGAEEPGTVFYVGDHPTDAMCVARAREELRERGRGLEIWSIAVLYGGESTDEWPVPPDFTARRPEDVVEIADTVGRCGRNAGTGAVTAEGASEAEVR